MTVQNMSTVQCQVCAMRMHTCGHVTCDVTGEELDSKAIRIIRLPSSHKCQFSEAKKKKKLQERKDKLLYLHLLSFGTQGKVVELCVFSFVLVQHAQSCFPCKFSMGIFNRKKMHVSKSGQAPFKW